MRRVASLLGVCGLVNHLHPPFGCFPSIPLLRRRAVLTRREQGLMILLGNSFGERGAHATSSSLILLGAEAMLDLLIVRLLSLSKMAHAYGRSPCLSAMPSWWTFCDVSAQNLHLRPWAQSRVYRVTHLRTDSVYCREFTVTGPVT